MRARTRLGAGHPGIVARRAPRDLLDRRLRPRDRGARRRRALALVLGRLALHLGAAGRRGGGDAVRRRARPRPARARPPGGGRRPPPTRWTRLLGADALAAVRQVGDRRRGGPGRRPHRRRLHPVRGRRHGRARLRPGQHDGPRHGAGRDGGGLRGGRGRPRRAPDGRARRRGGRGRGRPRPPVGGARRGAARGRAVAGALRPARRGPPRAGRGAAAAADAGARLRARGPRPTS